MSGSATDVFAKAGASAAPVGRLLQYSVVTLVESSGGCVLVARDGRRLGYVRATSVERIP